MNTNITTWCDLPEGVNAVLNGRKFDHVNQSSQRIFINCIRIVFKLCRKREMRLLQLFLFFKAVFYLFIIVVFFSVVVFFLNCLLHLICIILILIYDKNPIRNVIWEKLAYWGTKRTWSDQTPCVLRGVWSEPLLFARYSHLQKTIFSLSAQF